ncbi:MAG TPA: MFS transporter [Acidothermaceae bacterium]|jgi:predicted MFS family arabinose efflux permease
MHIDVERAMSPVRRTAAKTVRAAADRTGSRARLRAIATLAAVIALDGADKGTVSATANDLKTAFHVGNTDIGVLLTIVSVVSAVLTVPMGVLTDRISRTRLLAVTIVGWAIAVAISGTATSFMFLLLTRIGLAAVTAAAGPAVASLIGDLFPTDERGKIYGRILAGELIGTGLGLVGSTFVAGMFGWRWAFWWLVLPTLAVAWVMFRTREPGRDQADVLEAEPGSAWHADDDTTRSRGAMRRALRRAKVRPREEMVLRSPPDRMSLRHAVVYVLRVPTNRILIVASALGYFFFAGLRGFAVEFSQYQYGVSKSQASGLMLVIGAGALVGVFVGGRLADRLVGRGVVAGRVWVPAIALIAVPVFLGPALWASQVAIALPLIVVGAAVLSSANPPQDAARLDIMHPRLWGRSESIRSLARTGLEAVAPLLFGFTSEHLLGGDGAGLQATFLIFLIALPAAGGMGLLALRSYPRDVATAEASIDSLGEESAAEPAERAS